MNFLLIILFISLRNALCQLLEKCEFNSLHLAVLNECSALGCNEPIEKNDCQIYIQSAGFCCYLTATFEKTDSEGKIIKTKKKSCIKAPSKDPNERNAIIANLAHLGAADLLIECYSHYQHYSLLLISLIVLLLIYHKH